MRRVMVGHGGAMIVEVRRQAPVFPALPRRRGVLALAAFLLGVALFNVWLSGRYYRLGYAVTAALEEKKALERERDLLKTEILTLRSPARIEAIAKSQLGMVDPQTERMIR
ncbi:MAG: cell division protein FtsL [Deltaproteobacteria bacterium]